MSRTRNLKWIALLILCIASCALNAQNCEVDFPGSSTLTFSGECGGSTVDDLTLGKNTFIGDNDEFTFDSPATININGNFQVNAQGDGKIVIPAGVTVNVSGNFQLDAQNSGCESGNACTFEFVVEGTLNVNSNLQNNLVTLIWSGTGTVDVDDNFEISSNGCMECGSTCPAFPAGNSCTDDGDGCAIDFCVDGNYGNNSPLPVVLLFFNGQSRDQDVLLQWATASEENFHFFTIEHSLDAQEFYPIGTVEGKGFSSSRIDYSFIHSNPFVGRSYYRLKATDYDGFVEYFHIVKVLFDNRYVKLIPQPSKRSLQVLVSLEPDQEAILTIFNSSGARVFSGALFSGSHEISIRDISSGVYTANIKYPQVTRVVKLIF